MSLNQQRYKLFKKCATKNKINLASLPPTEEAVRQHSYRVYLQVQLWLGHIKNPEDWGWTFQNNILLPVTTLKAPAPDQLLKCISCSCKKGCGKNCGCRKAGLKCSIICGHCKGQWCTNSIEIEVDCTEDCTLSELLDGIAEDEGECET